MTSRAETESDSGDVDVDDDVQCNTREEGAQPQHRQQHQPQHQHLKLYKPAKVLSQFVFNHRKRRNRTLLGEFVDAAAFQNNNTDNNNNLMAIGRLDEDSEGLLLLTTDGKVSKLVRGRMVEKEYWLQVNGQITEDALEHLRDGVQICIPSSKTSSSSPTSSSIIGHGRNRINSNDSERGVTGMTMYTTLPCRASRLETVVVENNTMHDRTADDDLPPRRQNNNNMATKRRKRKFRGACNMCGNTGHKALECEQNSIIDRNYEQQTKASAFALPPGISPSSRLPIRDHGPTSWISITITEGKYRQVRKMTSVVGYPTLRLVRVRIGNFTLDGMKEGEVRILRQAEIVAIIM